MGDVTPPRPLAESDDRQSFDCGRESLNAWLRRHAWNNHVAGLSRTSVICDAGSGAIVGFVALSIGQIERAALPKPQRRNTPDPIPATLLGQLAVHKDRQGQGHGSSLLRFALLAALRASRDVGSFGVLTHPLDDQVRALHAKRGFADLPGDPRRGMLVRMADLEAALAPRP